MTEFTPSQNDDEEIDFKTLMKGVKRIETRQADLGRKPKLKKSPELAYRRQVAEQEPERFIDGLSADVSELVESEDELLFAVPGIQIKRLKRLRQGHIPWEQGLDLHGYTVESARDEVSRFIRDAQRQQARCVLIVHGKAFSQPGQSAVLKSCINDWLRQMHAVLAFSSAQPKDGGTGAVYVLLKTEKVTRFNLT